MKGNIWDTGGGESGTTYCGAMHTVHIAILVKEIDWIFPHCLKPGMNDETRYVINIHLMIPIVSQVFGDAWRRFRLDR